MALGALYFGGVAGIACIVGELFVVKVHLGVFDFGLLVFHGLDDGLGFGGFIFVSESSIGIVNAGVRAHIYFIKYI